MEELVVQRINTLLKRKQVTKRAVSQHIGMNTSTFTRQLSGDNCVSLETILGVITYFPELSTEWLLRGVGEMELSKDSSNPDISLKLKNSALEEKVNDLRERITELKDHISELKNHVSDLRHFQSGIRPSDGKKEEVKVV